MDEKQLAALLHRIEQRADKEDYRRVEQLAASYAYLTELVADKDTTIESLRKLLRPKSEKTSAVLGDQAGTSPSADEGETNASGDEPAGDDEDEPPAKPAKPRKPGHGRNGVDKFPGAKRVAVPHDSLTSGDRCPECGRGKVYSSPPRVLLRFTGQTPLQATIYELDRLRCSLCGASFVASEPAEAGGPKYDAQAISMIGLLKYGLGMPFNRFARLQRSMGIPLPPSTQWDLVRQLWQDATPVHHELIRQAAQADVLYVDDTAVRILEAMEPNARAKLFAEEPDLARRKGLFTSGVVAVVEARQIALFYSGARHAGENMRELLRQRSEELSAPIQMSDGLSRNSQSEFDTLMANCLTHGRRKFVDCHPHFPDQCRVVILSLKSVYKNDAAAKGMSDVDRLAFHQRESGPVMAELHDWLSRQLSERKTEENSALGGAIKYMLKRWPELTLFLREPGAPLDNNICERALKRIIIHRKNSLFFKTLNGASAGDCLMSLIYTCELNNVAPFEYLTAIQLNSKAAEQAPHQWLPWNYQATQSSQTPNAA